MGRSDYTDLGGTGQAFLTTHWSLIDGAVSDDHEKRQALIGLLLQRYWKPVYCYLRRKGYNNEQAKDLTQGFFCKVVLEHHLIEKADAAKGRFRTLLLVALDRYLSDVRDRETAQKRRPKGRLISLDVAEPPEVPPSITRSAPENTFHYAWVSALLEQVFEEVERACHHDDKTVHWCVFRDRVLDPIMGRQPPPALNDIVSKYGLETESKASNMIVTVKRRFQAAMRRRLRESVTSDQDVSDEWAEIRRSFPIIAQDSQ
jgi:RNA polymerase sigma-70 factor (ECF subfamily)